MGKEIKIADKESADEKRTIVKMFTEMDGESLSEMMSQIADTLLPGKTYTLTLLIEETKS